MTDKSLDAVALQSYLESRTNIRELEQRQSETINRFLAMCSTIIAAGISIPQTNYIETGSRSLFAASFMILAQVVSVGLYFSWCSSALMIYRSAQFCISLIENRYKKNPDLFWDTWLKMDTAKNRNVYLFESTLAIFSLPCVVTISAVLFFWNDMNLSCLIAIAILSICCELLLILQFRRVVSSYNSTPVTHPISR